MRSTGWSLACVCALLLLFAPTTLGDESTHRYTSGEPVVLWLNKVGPYHNPQETYSFFTLPYCKIADKAQHKFAGLGEAIEGNQLANSGYTIEFKKNIDHALACEQTADEFAAQAFSYAVQNHYWYQAYIDDLPIWGMVGDMGEDEDKMHHSAEKHQGSFMFTHKRFNIAFNGDRIIEVNLTSENPVEVKKGVKLQFTYSVEWKPTKTEYEKRFERYLDYSFFEHQIHTFSIFNSFMMVLFLVSLVALILVRTLRNDYARFTHEDDDLEDFERGDISDEMGWKQVQGDVFRAPSSLTLLSTLFGSGVQLACIALLAIFYAMYASIYTGRGAALTGVIVLYALTSVIGGFVSAGYYARHKGSNWIRAMIFQACLIPFVVFGSTFALNFVAIAYASLAAIPFGSMVAVVSIWLFVACPLTLVGTILGKNLNANAKWACRINAIPRQIPEKKWFLRTPVIVLVGGILPFGSIFIEMYFIFTSFWNYKFYYVYGFMLLVFLILVIVTVCVTIVTTYFVLNSEDYRWPWISFSSAASTALYVFFYSVYYFVEKTKMYGLFQTIYYFGYMGMLCAALAVLCGGVGFAGANLFVQRIYRGIKSD